MNGAPSLSSLIEGELGTALESATGMSLATINSAIAELNTITNYFKRVKLNRGVKRPREISSIDVSQLRNVMRRIQGGFLKIQKYQDSISPAVCVQRKGFMNNPPKKDKFPMYASNVLAVRALIGVPIHPVAPEPTPNPNPSSTPSAEPEYAYPNQIIVPPPRFMNPFMPFPFIPVINDFKKSNPKAYEIIWKSAIMAWPLALL